MDEQTLKYYDRDFEDRLRCDLANKRAEMVGNVVFLAVFMAFVAIVMFWKI